DDPLRPDRGHAVLLPCPSTDEEGPRGLDAARAFPRPLIPGLMALVREGHRHAAGIVHPTDRRRLLQARVAADGVRIDGAAAEERGGAGAADVVHAARQGARPALDGALQPVARGAGHDHGDLPHDEQRGQSVERTFHWVAEFAKAVRSAMGWPLVRMVPWS